METFRYNFSWESDKSHQIFWKHQKNLAEQAKYEVGSIAKLIKIQPPGKILDVGCGLGYHLSEFANRGFTCIGIEVSDFILEQSRKNTRALSLLKS